MTSPLGFKVIGEMAKEELIEEILATQRIILDSMTMTDLKQHVVQGRVAAVTKRLYEEAGITPCGIGGLFGATHAHSVDGEDENENEEGA